jgi:DNA polymerase V
MFALVDCNNFYCSCERVFDPSLNGRPVVVLSNNDGCVIARSEEAKEIGIRMAIPEYMIRDVIQKHRVAVFSSNYTLYGDMSARVMKILASFVPAMELYSIDEAFLDTSALAYTDLLSLGIRIRRTVFQNTGIPVTIGIAPTKALAKIANRFAKKKFPDVGVHCLANDALIKQALEATAVGDVWGIGGQYAAMLSKKGILNAWQFSRLPAGWVKMKMSVVGQRLLQELNGIPTFSWELEPARKKNICTSRSFGTLSGKKDVLAEAISNHAASCALKLRNDTSCARLINVFIVTNQFRTQDKQYSGSITLEAEIPTNDSGEIIRYALKGLDIIFQPGHNYMKCGVLVSEIVPEEMLQSALFDKTDHKRNQDVMKAIDKINQSLGKETVRFAVQGFEKRYKLRQHHLSQRYTTHLDELLHIKN